jgi:hypothetical protein
VPINAGGPLISQLHEPHRRSPTWSGLVPVAASLAESTPWRAISSDAFKL